GGHERSVRVRGSVPTVRDRAPRRRGPVVSLTSITATARACECGPLETLELLQPSIDDAASDSLDSRSPLFPWGHPVPERRTVVASTGGLHARPAAVFVKAAADQPTAVSIRKPDGDPVDASTNLSTITTGGDHG